MNEFIIGERWVLIQCFDIKERYYISNCGKIRNIDGKYLSMVLSNGYLTVCLQLNDNRRKTFYVHILVAMMFIPRENEYQIQVNHKDMCRCNNYVSNLEWTTQLENIEHEMMNRNNKKDFSSIEEKYRKNKGWGTGELTYGENNGMANLTEIQVHSICKLVEQGYSYSQALINSGIPDTENNRYNVSHIVAGKRWKHISSQYNISTKNFTDFSQYVIPVCELLEQGYSSSSILDTLNLPGNRDQNIHFIGRIRRKKIYKEIVSNYNF